MPGQVTLDGVDIRRLQLRWYRHHLGLVSQEPTLFATSIAANIAYGRPDASEQDIEAAARAANAHTFISKLPLRWVRAATPWACPAGAAGCSSISFCRQPPG